MSEFVDDVIAQLVDDTVGVYGTNIFKSSKAAIPAGNGPFLSVIGYGGMEPLKTQNSVVLPAYQRPSVQLVARASTFSAAMTMLRAAYVSLVKVRNQMVNGTYYREMVPIQEPFDSGVDSASRATATCNFRGVKRP